MANAVEAVVSAWTISEGAEFVTGDTIAEVETEKALVDLPAEQDGILGRILAKPGESTEVGAPIAVIISRGETEADIDAALEKLDIPAARPSAVSEPAASPAAAVSDEVQGPETARIFASPIARVKAREAGLDLSGVAGSGPNGRIVRADIEAALARPTIAVPAPTAPTAPSGAAAGARYTAIPHTGMRKAIARRLTESKSTVPHFYLTTDCRVDELLAIRARVNESSPIKISVNDFVVKAAAAAFADVPAANVTWTDTHLRLWDAVDIAIAVATDGGLLTPVLRGVGNLTLSEIASGISELAGRARAGRLRQDELEGGSFSVSNLGMYGTREFSAILNPPQSGILAIGAATPQPVVVDGQIVAATVMRCTLSVDHRAVDGALAAQWLAAFTARIENPLSILI
jgi:pyruvate dehydrogenase E2 component (dihydrolipoamide acetyltransferase)